LKAALYLELGRALINNGESKDAARDLFLGYIYSQIGGLSSLRLHLRAMALLTRAYFELKDYDTVHQIAGAAMCQVHLMNHREAVGIMRVVADTYKKQTQIDNYHTTLEALSTIIAEGSRDSLAKAAVEAELGVVELEVSDEDVVAESGGVELEVSAEDFVVEVVGSDRIISKKYSNFILFFLFNW